jgi:hypothetical protein
MALSNAQTTLVNCGAAVHHPQTEKSTMGMAALASASRATDPSASLARSIFRDDLESKMQNGRQDRSPVVRVKAGTMRTGPMSERTSLDILCSISDRFMDLYSTNAQQSGSTCELQAV